MKIIYGNRRSGRTTELIKMCAQDRYSLIVCPNIYMCNSVYQLSRKLGYRITMPITIHQFASGQFKNKQIENFYFDELEFCLQSLGKNVPVKAFVFNKQFTEIVEVKNDTSSKV